MRDYEDRQADWNIVGLRAFRCSSFFRPNVCRFGRKNKKVDVKTDLTVFTEPEEGPNILQNDTVFVAHTE